MLLMRTRRRRRLPARAMIVSPRKSTVISKDGAVHSAQSAELSIAQADLDRLWNPTNLENLARTYWRFLSRVTLGLIRVKYGDNERSVVFLGRPVTLLRFEAPEYGLGHYRGTVRWRIRDGLLVKRSGRGSGFLALDVRRSEVPESDGTVKVRIEVDVSNFYPSIAAGFSTPVYEATQSAIHVLVTHSFLRSLATLDLADSKVGRLAAVDQPTEEELRAAAAQNGAAAADGDSAVADAGQGPELGAIVPGEHAPHGA
jgi:hypothetical protein